MQCTARTPTRKAHIFREKNDKFSKDFARKTCGHRKYSRSIFIPLEAEMYDPVMIPFPSYSHSPTTPKEASPSQKSTINDKEILNDSNTTCYDILCHVKLGIRQIQSINAKQMEQKVLSHQARNKLCEVFPEIFQGTNCDLKLIA